MIKIGTAKIGEASVGSDRGISKMRVRDYVAAADEQAASPPGDVDRAWAELVATGGCLAAVAAVGALAERCVQSDLPVTITMSEAGAWYIRLGPGAPTPAALRRAERDAEVARLAAAGRTRREIADATGACYTTVASMCRRLGLSPLSALQGGDSAPERTRRMCEAHDAGASMWDIAREWGVSRERVRQILKNHGGGRTGAGQTERKRAARAGARALAWGASVAARYGCTPEQLEEVKRVGREMIAAGAGVETTPLRAYSMQKSNVQNNDGIEWRITFWEWWCAWRDSGRWAARGRGRGYQLVRVDRSLPFRADNVEVIDGSTRAARVAALRAGYEC